MSSCLRMALAFSTSTSSAKLNSSVGDFGLEVLQLHFLHAVYSKRGKGELLGFRIAARLGAVFGEGERIEPRR